MQTVRRAVSAARLIAALLGFKGAAMPNVKRRRRLGDLYVRGKDIEIDDGTGDPVPVWLQKLNEIERDAVLRRATAAKARHRLECEHEESEMFMATLTSVVDYLDRDGMTAIVMAEPMVKARERFEEQMRHDENGWGKDDKIQTLIDAWTGTDDAPGLAAAFAEDENDPAAIKVKDEIERFEAELDHAIERETERLTREWEDMPEMELARRVAREILSRKADEAFLGEWTRQHIFHCVRETDDHAKRYFESLIEVDDLDDKVRRILDRHMNELFVDLREGKESPATPASSTLSESTVVEVRSNLSGLEAVNG